MRLKPFLFILIITSSCYQGGQELGKALKQLQESNKKEEAVQKEKPVLNGTITQENKQIGTSAELKYEDGKKNGLSRAYYPDGSIWKESYYQNDVLHGTAKVYDRQGRLEREVNYDQGKKHGIYTRYFKSGKASMVINYDHNLPLPGYLEKDYLGKPVPIPEIKVKHLNHQSENNTYTLEINLEPDKGGATFYLLPNDSLWNSQTSLRPFQLPHGQRSVTFKVEPGYYLDASMHVFAVFPNQQGNEVAVKRSITNLRLQN